MIDEREVGQKATSIDIFIVNWNTSELLSACLRSLQSTDEASGFNIVVVDNGSSDNSVALVRELFPDVSVIENDYNAGFARAHNQAFATTSSPYVLLLNSDAEVPSGTISHCRDLLERQKDIGVVGCGIQNPDGSAQNSVFRYPSIRGIMSTSLMLAQAFPNSEHFNFDRYGGAVPTHVSDVEVVMGSFMMLRRSDLDGELLDDGYFMYTEEVDLCRRMADLGLRVVFDPTVSITHVSGGSTRSPAQKAWSYEAKRRSVLRYLRKWRSAPVAHFVNLLLLADMLPRSLGWIVSDGIAVLRRGEPVHHHKLSIVGFHLRSAVKPQDMDARFHGPPT